MDFGNLSGNDQPEMSLTLKYLLENPSLLQPPDANGNDEMCKEDKTCEQQNDLTAAYLGPQIWSDMLLSDDLKLEPVDLDELLDPTGIEDEMNDLSRLMSNSPPRAHVDAQPPGNTSLMNYQDMPPLMTTHSHDGNNAVSPSQYFSATSPHQTSDTIAQTSVHSLPTMHMQHMQAHKMSEQQLCTQQLAIYNDICANNQFKSTVPQQIPHNPAKRLRLSSQPAKSSTEQVMPAAPSVQCQQTFPGAPSEPPQGEEFHKERKRPALGPPIEIRIPSPKLVDFVPDTADVIISTPHMEEGEGFDPSKRCFTEDELKPQPIIRKSKKVYVSTDSKDGRYWNRRNKNNVAAKRSREARRIKENQIAMRANYLEKENSTLKTEISELRKELTRVMEIVRKYEDCFPQVRK